MKRLLFVDDDIDSLTINKSFFEKEGYQVICTDSGKKALAFLKKNTVDCIILDIMMPDISGYDVCEKIREFNSTPVIYVSGLGTEDSKIKGLMTGGDDYVIKPYSLRELSARITAHIRRAELAGATVKPTTRIEYPPLSLDLVSHKAFYNEEEIPLSNKEYELLHLLVSNPNTILTFKEIGEQVWGSYIDSDRRTITVTASRLRKKIESCAGLTEIITTEWSKGYRFTPR